MRLIRAHPVLSALFVWVALMIVALVIAITVWAGRAFSTLGALSDNSADGDIETWHDDRLAERFADADDSYELAQRPQVGIPEIDLVWVDHLTPGACVRVRYKSRVTPPSRLVKPVDCAEAHDVAIAGTHVFDVASHPDAEALQSEVWTSCVPDAERHTGEPVDVHAPPTLDMLNAPTVGRVVVYWIPSDDELQRGDRYIVCGVLVGPHPDD